jgi:hypothetical protein
MSSTMAKKRTPNLDVIDALAASAHSRKWVELKVAALSQGVVSALASSTMTPSQAWNELFNLDNYQAIRRHRLNADLRELFEWGMELMSLEKHVPRALPQSYEKMSALANRVIRRGMAAPRRRQAV